MQWKRQVIFNEQGFIAVIFYYAQESAPPAQRPLATLQPVIRGQWKGGGGGVWGGGQEGHQYWQYSEGVRVNPGHICQSFH